MSANCKRKSKLNLPGREQAAAVPTARYGGGAFQCAGAIECAIREAVAESGLSDQTIASEVSRLVGNSVSPEQVAGWGGRGGVPAPLPLEYTAALGMLLEDDSIARAAHLFADGGAVSNAPESLREAPGPKDFEADPEGPKTHLVRAWMSANRISTNDVADELGVTAVAVRRWMLGNMTSANVRQWFVDKGCPVRFVGEARQDRKNGKS